MEQATKKNLLSAVTTGLLALAITILGTLLLNYCTGRKSSLSYDAKLSDAFEKDSVQLRTCSLELQNDGDALLVLLGLAAALMALLIKLGFF